MARRSSRWPQRGGLAAAALALLLVLAPGVVERARRDLSASDDAELIVARLVLPDADNGIHHLTRAARQLDWPGERPGSFAELILRHTGDASFAPALVERNRAALEHVERALGAPAFQEPERRDGGARMAGLDDRLSLSDLLAARALARAARGDGRGALVGAVQVFRLADRLAEAHGAAVLELAIALRIKSDGLALLVAALSQAPPAAEDAREQGRALAAATLSSEAWRRVWSAEYAELRGALVDVESDPRIRDGRAVGGPPLAARRGALDSLAGEYRRIARQGRRPCASLRPDASRESRGLVTTLANDGGHTFLAIALPSPRGVHLQRCLGEFHLAAARVLLALHGHHATHGALPPNLDALVPEWLAAVPRDPFDGAPLRFSPERGRVYSVGRDGVDGGGAVGRGMDDLDEPSVPIGL